MRILQIRFKNLNSLVGEWLIDLSHPAYSANGIFAITGPTGAGKSTILDAICLALYGRTPRLAKISKSSNEIMSRQTGECYAEVTFSTQTGHYRCHWSQRRAHKRAEGELQSPKHEMADATTGKIVETKLRGVAEQIDVATGMSFEQFIRSMLLAQGGFAAFLQAAADQRAPILEQITGTEIYSALSMQTHQLRAQQRKILEQLQSELTGIQLITPEEEEYLQTTVTQQAQQEIELQHAITQTQQALNWLDLLSELSSTQQQLQQQTEQLQEQHQQFAPQQRKLNRALAALELNGDYASLSSLRQEQVNDQCLYVECQQASLQEKKQAIRTAETVHHLTQQLDEQKNTYKTVLPILRQARELDLKIQEKIAPIATLQTDIVHLQQTLTTLTAKQHDDQQRLLTQQTALTELQQQLENHQADQQLVTHLAGIQERFATLRRNARRLITNQHSQQQMQQELSIYQQSWQQHTERLAESTKQQEVLQQNQQTLQLQLEQLLAGNTLAEWRDRLLALTTRKALLADLVTTAEEFTHAHHLLPQLTKHSATLQQQHVQLTTQLEQLIQQQVDWEKERHYLETQYLLLQRIEQLEEARRMLQDGEPCPLCGATHHPFATENIPTLAPTTAQLQHLRTELKAINTTINRLQVQLAEINKDCEQNQKNQQEQHAKITQYQKLFTYGQQTLQVDYPIKEFVTRLPILQQNNSQQLGYVDKQVQSAEQLEKYLIQQALLLDNQQKQCSQQALATQTALYTKQSAEQQLHLLNKEATELTDHQQQLQQLLQQDLTAYNVNMPTIEHLDEALKQLSVRCEQWLQRQHTYSEVEKATQTLTLQIYHQADTLKNYVQDLQHKQQSQIHLQHHLTELQQQRQELLAHNDPEQEEQRLLSTIETMTQQLESAKQQQNNASQKLTQLQAKIAELNIVITQRNLSLQSQELNFLNRLHKSEFINEQAFITACLTESERQQLTQQAQQLTDQQIILTSQLNDVSKRLQQQQQKQLTELPAQTLTIQLTEQLNKQRTLQREIGAIQQKLIHNQQLTQTLQQKLDAITQQKHVSERWELLYELIGSADGKKFRNFAQGITFEIMIQHANQQLQKMTDRYLLINDATQPLELNVIDNYQAGEIRSTKNLSGGESFIVSLALALGLSYMASKNVRVDSLFLDEGFGTLDEETLDTALETLANLQQDGKLIGVISHVLSLQDRISTQIQVTPLTGGKSDIHGPGCQHLP